MQHCRLVQHHSIPDTGRSAPFRTPYIRCLACGIPAPGSPVKAAVALRPKQEDSSIRRRPQTGVKRPHVSGRINRQNRFGPGLSVIIALFQQNIVLRAFPLSAAVEADVQPASPRSGERGDSLPFSVSSDVSAAEPSCHHVRRFQRFILFQHRPLCDRHLSKAIHVRTPPLPAETPVLRLKVFPQTPECCF